MSAFSCYSILKSNAKKLARAQGIKLSMAQELIAKQAKFTDFHDLATVAKRDPMDARLLAAALGGVDLRETIYEDPAYTELNIELEEQLSGLIAETNAYDFTMEDIDVTGANYDEATGILTLEISFTYQGVQDPDRAYSATEFYMDALVRLKRRNDQWSLADDGIEILRGESDQDRDWAEQMADEANEVYRRQTFVQALAKELKLSDEEAELLTDAETHPRETSDGLVTSYWIDLRHVAVEPLRSKLLEEHGDLMVEVGPNFFDQIFNKEF